MKISRFLVVIFTMALLSSCISFEPKYEIQQADSQFIKKIRESSSFSILSNDVVTPSEKIDQAGIFGALGVLAADAGTKNVLEDAGINIYKSLPEMLQTNLKGNAFHFVPNPSRMNIDNQTLSKRIKKNRMWGTRKPDAEQVKLKMKKLADVEYGLYVRTWIGDFKDKTENDTTWIFYNKDGEVMAKFKTDSYIDRPKEDTATMALERYRLLQKMNINKFVELLVNGSAVAGT